MKKKVPKIAQIPCKGRGKWEESVFLIATGIKTFMTEEILPET